MGVNKFNCEGYYDPTAYEALTKIEKEAKALRAFRPVVYICSPLAGDMLKNQENARTYCRFAVEAGLHTIAPGFHSKAAVSTASGSFKKLPASGKPQDEKLEVPCFFLKFRQSAGRQWGM